MRARRDFRRRRLVLALVLVVALLSVTGGGNLRDDASSLAGEWWDCLAHQRPPTAFDENFRAQRQGTTRYLGRTGKSAPAERTSTTMPRKALNDLHGSDGQAQLPHVTVAVLDSGVEALHDDLRSSQVRAGVDLLNPCGDGRTDSSGHGTAVAGVIASSSRGAAAGVRLLPVRTSLSTGTGLRPITAAGIVWATRHGADVINLSWASNSAGPRFLEHAAVRYAVNRGVVIVASAGNDPAKPVGYPAAYPEVIAVASVDKGNRLSRFGSRGEGIDVAAPGSRVQTLAVNDGYRVGSGTSVAAPLVTAAGARMKALNPELSPARIQALLRRTSSPVHYPGVPDGGMPFGVLDLEAALRAVDADATSVHAHNASVDADDTSAEQPAAAGA